MRGCTNVERRELRELGKAAYPRERFNRYRHEDPSMVVAFALSRGYLEEDRAAEERLAELASWIGCFRRCSYQYIPDTVTCEFGS